MNNPGKEFYSIRDFKDINLFSLGVTESLRFLTIAAFLCGFFVRQACYNSYSASP